MNQEDLFYFCNTVISQRRFGNSNTGHPEGGMRMEGEAGGELPAFLKLATIESP